MKEMMSNHEVLIRVIKSAMAVAMAGGKAVVNLYGVISNEDAARHVLAFASGVQFERIKARSLTPSEKSKIEYGEMLIEGIDLSFN